jgi:pSer/pThr/pTyr-binding forkhead associated (FHA) protein
MGSGQYRSPDVSSGQYRSPDPSPPQYRAPAEQPSAPPPQAAVALAPSRTQASRDTTPQDPEQLAPNSPAVLAGFLVSYDEKELGQFWPLNQGQNAIGRKGAADGLDIEIDHPTTSSRHAVLLASARPARIKLEDQGSTNGTFVNDHKLETGRRQELRDGDIVRFGGFVTIIKIV